MTSRTGVPVVLAALFIVVASLRVANVFTAWWPVLVAAVLYAVPATYYVIKYPESPKCRQTRG